VAERISKPEEVNLFQRLAFAVLHHFLQDFKRHIFFDTLHLNMGTHDTLGIADAGEFNRQEGGETFFMLFKLPKNKFFHDIITEIEGDEKA
jgi:hypothetical protein